MILRKTLDSPAGRSRLGLVDESDISFSWTDFQCFSIRWLTSARRDWMIASGEGFARGLSQS